MQFVGVINIVSVVVFLIIGILVWNFFSGRGKRSSEKTSTQSITDTLNRKIKKALRDIAKGLRTPEFLREQLKEEFQNARRQMKLNYGDYLTSIISSIERHNDVVTNSKTTYKQYQEEAKKFKKLYNDETDSNRKESYMKYSKEYLQMAMEANEQITKSEETLRELAIKRMDASHKQNRDEARLANYETETYDMFNQPSEMVEFQALVIQDLRDELKEISRERRIKSEVNKTLNESPLLNTSTIASTEVDVEWDKL